MNHIKFVDNWGGHLDSQSLKSMYPVGKRIETGIEYVDRFTPFLLEIIGDKPINLFVRGSSGAILAGILSKTIKNKMNIFHIKKDGENSHNDNYANWEAYKNSINIILDDFVSSGETVNAIYTQMATNSLPIVDILIVSEFQWHYKKWPLNFHPEYLICGGSPHINQLIEAENKVLEKEAKRRKRRKKEVDSITF